MTTIVEAVHKTREEVSELSYRQRKGDIDKFLDAINELRDHMKSLTGRVEQIVEGFSGLTWYKEYNEEALKEIHTTVVMARDLHKRLLISFTKVNKVCRKKKILQTELNDYKYSLNELEEVVDDIDLIFFEFPNDPEVQRINKFIDSH